MSKVKPIKCRPDLKKLLKPSSRTSLLSELGKATKRGVKKCPNCGYINGNRGFMCKNTLCGKIFKASDKRKLQLDSVKIETGTSRQIYSVRVQEDLPDERGFVQLPILEEGKKNRLIKVALCFVESCQRLFDDSILKCHEVHDSPAASICNHIESAFKSITNASCLDFKHELINGLKVDDEVKKKLCLLAKSTDGPLVQKVSFNVFAIKCLVSPNYPLGYLHLKVFSSKEDGEEFHCFSCDCSDLIINCSDIGKTERGGFRCEHYYAAICAFASDNVFSCRFSNAIQAEFNQIYLPGFDLSFANILGQENGVLQAKDSNVNIKIVHTNFPSCKRQVLKKNLNARVVEDNGYVLSEKTSSANVLLPTASLDFNLWLSSITESINNKFKSYKTDKSMVLTFHIPNSFYEVLRNLLGRTFSINEKAGITKDPYSEEKYLMESWHIINVTDLCKVFNTNLIKLNIFDDPSVTIMFKQLQAKKLPLVTIEWVENTCKVTKFGELKITIKN